MKRIVNNICVILIFAIFAGLVIVRNVQYRTVPVVVERGSYADTFADEKHLPKAEITDDLKNELDIRYEGEQAEIVKANLSDEKGNYIEVVKGDVMVRIYDDGTITDGTEELHFDSKVITTTTEITEIADSEKVYLIQNGDTLGEIAVKEGAGIYEIAKANGIENVNLIYAGESLSIPTQKIVSEITTVTVEANEKSGVKTTGSATFNYAVSPMSACQFGYNAVNNEIELIYYYGTEKKLVIPSHIAGYPVTKVAFDLVGNYDAVVIPATVTSITGKVSDVLYTPVFFIEMIFSVLAFMLVLICNNVFLPRLKNEKEFLLSGPQIVSSLLYLTAQLLFAVLSIYHYVSVSNYTALAVSAVLLIGYILAIMLSGTGRSHVKRDEQKTALKTEFMKNFSRECMNLSEGITDREAKKQVDRLVEDIRFSDKVSSVELLDIEEKLELKVKELRVAIRGGDPENIMDACKKAKSTLDERNRLAKAAK